MGLLWQQFIALCWKNWIVMLKHPIVNLLRCVVFPVGFGILLAFTPTFFNRTQNEGLGTIVPISSLGNVFSGHLDLVWVDLTNGTGDLTLEAVMARITKGFSSAQMKAVKKIDSIDELPDACPPKSCFGAISFDHFPASPNDLDHSINYTIHTEPASFYLDVLHHHTWVEEKILPLQLAIEHAIVELSAGTELPVPLEWPFTSPSFIDQELSNRLDLLKLMRFFLVYVFLLAFVGIAYHLPGAVASERATLLTPYMTAMGLSDWARTISWHVSLSLAYLPGWITVSLVWAYRIFPETNAGFIFLVHVLLGLSLASWSLFVAVPFGKSPHLASIVSFTVAVALAILASNGIKMAKTGPATVLSLVFPPMFYVFAIRSICGFELAEKATNAIHRDPSDGIILLPLLFMALINIFLWPYLAVLFERALYSPYPSYQTLFKKAITTNLAPIPEDAIISIRNLSKTYQTFRFRRFKVEVVNAIVDLSLDIPKHGVYALLGPNGAGKSTTLDILGGLTGRTSGSITFQGGASCPPQGTLGIVPQKNVLFPELSCLQTLQMWKEIKRSPASPADEDLEQLLRDCDLAEQIYSTSGTLSGGQKRKLQLAVSLVGGSTIILVDECTSGVDPISRRALWKTLTSHRDERTIILTTHFLDEADLLADGIAVLGSQGRLIAEGTPVALKSSLGEGYTVHLVFNPGVTDSRPHEVLELVRTVATDTYLSTPSPLRASYHLKTKDLLIIEAVLRTIESQKEDFDIESFDVYGTSIEDIFLNLMNEESNSETHEKMQSAPITSSPRAHKLSDGRPRSPWAQALTIFHKRSIILRRSWVAPLLAILIGILFSYFPIKLLVGGVATCDIVDDSEGPPISLYLPPTIDFLFGDPVLLSPPNVTSILNVTTTRSIPNIPSSIPSGVNQSITTTSGSTLPTLDARSIVGSDPSPDLYQNLADNATFVNEIKTNFANITYGGISLDLQTREALIAWAAYTPFRVLSLLNLANNILFNHALNTTGTPTIIYGSFINLPNAALDALVPLEWVIIFGVAMILYSSFFTLYVARERRSSVQAMQLSNGLSDPSGLWLGHLLFDSISNVLVATVIVAIFTNSPGRFLGLGLLWLVILLYCLASTLLSYCFVILVPSPLAAFSTVLFYQFIMLLLTLLPYVLAKTLAKEERVSYFVSVCHFTISLLAPISSLARASMVSINLFKLDCNGKVLAGESALGTIGRYGGPILYLIVQAFALVAILVWADSRSFKPLKTVFMSALSPRSLHSNISQTHDDVIAENKHASSSSDLLRVLNISKSFNGKTVVESVSFSAARDTIFAMLGPNGAGKTTTLDVIRGSLPADAGDVFINGASMMHHNSAARLSLGVCPQFSAFDAQLTTREHLIIYGRLKGLHGEELTGSVDFLLQSTGLDIYADRLAPKLSGGNQRKLSLAIALIGNPSVILIDEFSTGIDASMKRELWKLLKQMAPGKAFVITTHSMEEASALATKVGIISKRMLAVGTPAELAGRYPIYIVHFSCRTHSDRLKAQELMARIPGSKMAIDLSTRFEVPIIPTTYKPQPNVEQGASEQEKGFEERALSLPDLFHLLAQQTHFLEFTVERSTLEAAFIKIIRENDAMVTQSADGGNSRGIC